MRSWRGPVGAGDRDPVLAEKVRQVALAYRWWGYKRLAVICRHHDLQVSNRLVYRVLKEAKLTGGVAHLAEKLCRGIGL